MTNEHARDSALDSQSAAMHAAVNGDHEKLAAVITVLQPLLRAHVAYRWKGLSQSFNSPQDVVQDVWLVFLERLPTWELHRDGCSLTRQIKAFLVRTVLNMIRDIRRRSAPRHLESFQPRTSAGNGVRLDAVASSDPTAGASLQELANRLEAAVKLLRPADREILIVCVLEGRTSTEAAKLYAESGRPTTEAAIRKRLERVRSMLRDVVPPDIVEGLAAR